MQVVIPLYYNDPSLYLPISRCLGALQGAIEPVEVILVDDASPLEHDFNRSVGVTYLRNEQNEGFTKTVNRGLLAATDDVIVVMNDDIIVTDECLRRFSELTGLTIASPMDTASSPDDRFGACWGMTREVYETLGNLNDYYTNFFSDSDYYERARMAGVEIVKWTDITLEHPESSTYKLLDKEALLNADRKRYYAE